MQTEQHTQGGMDWHAWRRGGVGSSEVPVIMGESEFATPFKLWERKTGRATEEKENFAMARGTEAEPKIRALYELQNDIDMPATLIQHPDLEFARASLDGYNAEAKRGVEIKYVGAEKHEMAKAGQVPLTYVGQVQWQLFVSGAEQMDYVSYDGQGIVVVPVKPDLAYWERMITAVTKFWQENVQKDVPPEMTDRDFKLIRDVDSKKLFESYAEMKRLADEYKEKQEAVRSEILARYPMGQVICGGVKLTRSERRGAVDYGKIPEVKALSPIYVESFRKKASVVLTLTTHKVEE